MASWQEFCDGVKKVTNQVIAETGELADSASLRVKLTQKNSKLSELYEQLGEINYKQIKGEAVDQKTIDDTVLKIDAMKAEIAEIKATIQAKKDAKKESEEAKKEADAE